MCRTGIDVSLLGFKIEVKEIALLFGVSRQTIYNWLKSGKLRSNKLIDFSNLYKTTLNDTKSVVKKVDKCKNSIIIDI